VSWSFWGDISRVPQWDQDESRRWQSTMRIECSWIVDDGDHTMGIWDGSLGRVSETIATKKVAKYTQLFVIGVSNVGIIFMVLVTIYYCFVWKVHVVHACLWEHKFLMLHVLQHLASLNHIMQLLYLRCFHFNEGK
jgi:hypothetical protein